MNNHPHQSRTLFAQRIYASTVLQNLPSGELSVAETMNREESNL